MEDVWSTARVSDEEAGSLESSVGESLPCAEEDVADPEESLSDVGVFFSAEIGAGFFCREAEAGGVFDLVPEGN